MFSLIFTALLAQTPTPPPEIFVQPGEVRSLPGELDSIPVFNSNSPEVVLEPGILLSTFPPEGKAHPNAHLNFGFKGRFDIFAHHIAKATDPADLSTLYLGILVHNPGNNPVTLDILQAASYLSQPDAPFIPLPPQLANPDGTIYAGPGSRVMSDILRGRSSHSLPDTLTIPPGESRLILNLPIPVATLEPPINGRSTLMKLESSETVYVASLARFAPQDERGNERPPTLAEWETLLTQSTLAGPRDRAPTPPDSNSDTFLYGRVAGVAQGSAWRAVLRDIDSHRHLTIPDPGESLSYPLSSLDRGTLGTNQIQSAPMLVRYPDTAYKAHGNYGIRYSIVAPLYNPKPTPQTVTLRLQTPIKQNEIEAGLSFFDPLPPQNFFRGTVRLVYTNDAGEPTTDYFHLVQRRGQIAEPLLELTLQPQENRRVQFDFLYPPDASPPQVFTITTQDELTQK
ncbi:MAG: DUF3370 domain-containing protein [Jaaginema sp. PMC 1079.18]|nr:DUF3370 domain-containing protein [Jaaginema sp. PMC 1080.18]MEC4853915.1 DUF3370 domain-containing protein [Jaaginema sp. PMC 1079.18]MEC4868664.1 DUF3370 domain-containing protein [Jaaginema sp. PMC 1078.18]